MYKLTTQDCKTFGGMTWAIGKTNKATGRGVALCTSDLLHCYKHPMLAVLLNPIHAGFENPRLFEIECSRILATDGLKHGCKEQTPIKELVLPVLTDEQK